MRRSRLLTAGEMAAFVAFVNTLSYTPNPNENLDRTMPNPPSGPNAAMGSNRFRIDMPRYITWYRQGRLKLDELVTQRLPLEEINRAFEDMVAGKVARSVITFP